MNTLPQTIRGMKDSYDVESFKYSLIQKSAEKVFERFGFTQILTPILEETSLFLRSIGEGTDIVHKEMYTFLDRDGTSVTLRPEGTASVCRAYIQSGKIKTSPETRWYYFGPMFRHERPQKGRLRQFHQVGAELFGIATSESDAEIIDMALQFLEKLGLKNLTLHINSVGCNICRSPYTEKLITAIDSLPISLPLNITERLRSNPLRIFDSKDEELRSHFATLPKISEALCESCFKHDQQLKRCLQILQIPYIHNPLLVRGLDYYTQTAFEILSDQLGAQSTVLAGGRYNNLIQELCDIPIPAIGWAAGVERISLLLDNLITTFSPDVIIIWRTEAAKEMALSLAKELRHHNIRVDMELEEKGIKNQFKRANKVNARFAVTIAENEVQTKQVMIKDLSSTEQKSIEFSQVLNFLQNASV